MELVKNSEKIKELAKKSLEDKWYDLDVEDTDEWSSHCAFCKEVKSREGRVECPECLIFQLPICDFICDCRRDEEDYWEVIEALEELAETGELLTETRNRLIIR